jgi:ATP-binding cassette subfamily E protein 1
MGRNGIGKSTVINILSKLTYANLGNPTQEFEDENKYFSELNQLFRGTALQNYFQQLKEGAYHISYKPQQIINIPKHFSGTVRSLLKRVSQKETKVEDTAKSLNISAILDRDISYLSGGELQRVALCSCLVRDQANLFIFDEISNYLDIFERLNASRYIMEQVEGKTALLIEHDLVVLDYLSEFIHIMYGQPGVYGRLTGIKSAKAGINAYLEGYSKEENVKFRDKPITFDKDSVSEATESHILAEWNSTSLNKGDFRLDITGGNIKSGEVLGIIGRNALGKSTFISHLAKDGLGDQVGVRTKPQLITPDKELVANLLGRHENFSSTFHQNYVLDPLNITPLLEKRADQLSGGELQRFALADCLLEDAQIYLLDEPTAFLDIEDRLKIAKVLKTFLYLKRRSCVVIDHDLVFLDYLSDRLLVFEGTPSKEGYNHSPLSMREGMNTFLKGLDITFRRDETNKRPRINKKDSVKDREQKSKGEYYYA